jgi:death-on-curing family protein
MLICLISKHFSLTKRTPLLKSKSKKLLIRVFQGTKKRTVYWKNMTKRLQKIPKIWLNLDTCRTIYTHFKEKVDFSEPLPSFDDRYEGRLESILGTIQNSFGGFHFYPTVLDAAAAYLVKFNCRHPFTNGNKRTSVVFTDTFLLLNDVFLNIPQEDLYNLAAIIAKDHEQGVSEKNHIAICKEIIADFTVDIGDKTLK